MSQEKGNRPQSQKALSKSKTLLRHVKTLDFFLICLLFFCCTQIFISITDAYSASINSTDTEEADQSDTPRKDFLTYLFENSLSTMLLSTFIIAIVGVLIRKLRDFKKKMDMIEVLTSSLVKMKRDSENREVIMVNKEKEFENRLIKSQDEVKQEIANLCSKMDIKTTQLEKKIEDVKDESTKALIKYLSESRDYR